MAAASVMYLGARDRARASCSAFLKPPLWLVTMIFVPATFALSWLGTKLSHAAVFDQTTWALIILVYCCVASLVPVWALLQPRGYLGGFVLYARSRSASSASSSAATRSRPTRSSRSTSAA